MKLRRRRCGRAVLLLFLATRSCGCVVATKETVIAPEIIAAFKGTGGCLLRI